MQFVDERGFKVYSIITMNFSFIRYSILLGVGLAMDAFSVSVANGLANPDMKRNVRIRIASVFAFFQFLMPLIGWGFVHLLAEKFATVKIFIPWIALGLLGFIGGKMIIEGIKDGKKEKEEAESGSNEEGKDNGNEEKEDGSGNEAGNDKKDLKFSTLIIQGIATSIDALSTGFVIEEYTFPLALCCALIIAVVTFLLCILGVFLGRKFGMKLANRATIVGGIVLIAIGLEIFIKNLFF